MNEKKKKRRLLAAALVLVVLVLLATMASTTGAVPSMVSKFCTAYPDGGPQKMCGGGLTGSQTGPQCKGNPLDC